MCGGDYLSRLVYPSDHDLHNLVLDGPEGPDNGPPVRPPEGIAPPPPRRARASQQRQRQRRRLVTGRGVALTLTGFLLAGLAGAGAYFAPVLAAAVCVTGGPGIPPAHTPP